MVFVRTRMQRKDGAEEGDDAERRDRCERQFNRETVSHGCFRTTNRSPYSAVGQDWFTGHVQRETLGAVPIRESRVRDGRSMSS